MHCGYGMAAWQEALRAAELCSIAAATEGVYVRARHPIPFGQHSVAIFPLYKQCLALGLLVTDISEFVYCAFRQRAQIREMELMLNLKSTGLQRFLDEVCRLRAP